MRLLAEIQVSKFKCNWKIDLADLVLYTAQLSFENELDSGSLGAVKSSQQLTLM